MPEQVEAITGRRIRKPYSSMISAQSAHLPEVYAAREQRQYQEEQTGLRARELTLMEEAQETRQEQQRRATALQAAGTGAMVGGMVGGPYGAAIGAGVGLVAWGISEYF